MLISCPKYHFGNNYLCWHWVLNVLGGDGPFRNLYYPGNVLYEMHLFNVCLTFSYWAVISGVKDKNRMSMKYRDMDSVHNSYQCSMKVFKHKPGDNSSFIFLSPFFFLFSEYDH